MTRAERREAMPLCTAFVDDVRDVFTDIVFLYASENGIELGERQPEGVQFSERWET